MAADGARRRRDGRRAPGQTVGSGIRSPGATAGARRGRIRGGQGRRGRGRPTTGNGTEGDGSGRVRRRRLGGGAVRGRAAAGWVGGRVVGDRSGGSGGVHGSPQKFTGRSRATGTASIDAMLTLPGWADAGLTWAPDVHKVTGGWALYFSCAAAWAPPGPTASVAVRRSPTGTVRGGRPPFICQLDHRGSIDARVFVDSDRHLVMLWKSEDNANPAYRAGPERHTGIYSQYLSANGRTLLGRPSRSSRRRSHGNPPSSRRPTWWRRGEPTGSSSPPTGTTRRLRDRGGACQSPLGPCADPNPAPFIGRNLQGPGPGEESLSLMAAPSTSSTTPSGPAPPAGHRPPCGDGAPRASPRWGRISPPSERAGGGTGRRRPDGCLEARSALGALVLNQPDQSSDQENHDVTSFRERAGREIEGRE